MALDNAQFISELSIVDPPGTDPVAEGDDHIRTTKRATQQSFPNVNAAVPQTAAQMGQMAIKNEVNVFTIQQQFHIGSNVAPGVSFAANGGDGMFLVSAGKLGFATLASTRFTIEAGLIRFTPVLRPDIDGTAAGPVYSFFNEGNMGMYRISASVLGWAVVGVRRMSLSNANLIMSDMAQIRNVLGSAAVPSYAFSTTTNMGMYQHDGNTLGMSVAGAAKQLIKAASTDFVQASSTGGISLNLVNSAGVTGYAVQYEGTAGFQPGQFSISRFNRVTGAFVDIPLYINATTGRVHTALPVLSP